MRTAASYYSSGLACSIRPAVVMLCVWAAAPLQGSPPADVAKKTSPSKAETASEDQPAAKPPPKRFPKLPPPAGAKRMPGAKHVWVDRKKRTVYVDGRVTLRRGVLEMFATLRDLKEHESVVAVDCRAKTLHAALLLAGAKVGTPVNYTDRYIPPTGDVIQITVEWLDEKRKKRSTSAQKWVRNTRTKKEMKLDWVFAGSGFWTDKETGKRYYMAERGDVICVANFSTAMLDIAIESTQSDEGLMFESFTERIPPLETPIRLVMTPAASKKPAAKEARQKIATPPKNPK